MTRYFYRLSAACLFGILLSACFPSESADTAATTATPPAAAAAPASAPAAASAPTAAADDGALKLETVQHLYAAVLRDEEAPPALFSADFRNTLERAGKSGADCLDYDPFIQGQDGDHQEIASSLKTRLLDSGEVQADFSSFGNPFSLRYVLACQNQQCLIDDILEEAGDKAGQETFKRRINACLGG